MINHLISIILLSLLLSCSPNKNNEIDWMTWEAAENRTEKLDKKGFVWIYTDWCTESEEMMNTHLQHPEVVAYINEHFYSILFDAEQKEPIQVKDKIWNFDDDGDNGYNELALVLTDLDPNNINKSLAYPKIVFLDEGLNKITPIGGRLELKELEAVLAFVATDSFKKMRIEEFMLDFDYQFGE